MSKIKKLTLLLEFSFSSDIHFEMLLLAMHKSGRPEFHDFFQQKRIILKPEKEAHHESGLTILLPNELIQPYNFDLEGLVTRCLNALQEKSGLFGFALPHPSLTLLHNFCKRLKMRSLRPANVQFKERPLIIGPFSMEIDDVIDEIKREHEAAKRKHELMKDKFPSETSLKPYNVLCKVGIAQERIVEFWQTLNQKFEEEKFAHRLIIIVAFKPVCALPKMEKLIPLAPEQLCFNFSLVGDWVSLLVGSQSSWKDTYQAEEFIEFWKECIIAECNCKGKLHIDRFYDHLNEMLPRLHQEIPVDQFKQALEERSKIYVTPQN